MKTTLVSLRVRPIKYVMVAAVLLFVAASLLACGSSALQVSEVQHDPLAFEGQIVVAGITSHFSQSDPRVFGVMDTAEMIQCGFNLHCGAWVMPVLYVGEGPVPLLGEEVELTGTFTFMGDDVMFQANSFKVIGNFANELN
ncbi:MAG: hypothetical protein FWF11_05215 [Coriobacteriia bacterium]|nr:hypothetical protein [Coriobacteriia bacterium]